MAKRTTCMLAHTYDIDKLPYIGGQFMSEKLDGMRCIYDSGVTIGMEVGEVPWANMGKATSQQKRMLSSGLWSRGWKPIFAPRKFTDRLPQCALDGELFLGRGRFQELVSITRSFDSNNPEWDNVRFKVFDSPTSSMFKDGDVEIGGGKTKEVVTLSGAQRWVEMRGWNDCNCGRFYLTYEKMLKKGIDVVEQIKLPQGQKESIEVVNCFFNEVLGAKGEGIILRHPMAMYACERSHHLNKLKPWYDDEGIVIGYITGREGVEGRHLGRMGALLVSWKGKEFKLSGFTDEERELVDTEGGDAYDWARNNPEVKCPHNIEAVCFPHGSLVTFKYRELSNDGVPKEARYWRKHVNQ